ncbi:ABC-F family ATP-binding cassette domain-containing protein [Dethiobacter alkaliphilus]|uniref:ABC transporter related protein n=1 Tax=Dethiobacter alkaliphilus AHT 1 TaxID=555088 RepID=C0GHF0_DETAL|nr:ABC-F family ATP-binding cassette domain-containing protein [Dethiobacter alkaliphilus]EEG77156.1 ABC transporter related protein [Dethiobacter alkaliphilus AHT 1]
MTVLTLNQISKAYGAEVICERVSFQLHQGERVGLVGPNGAGKTTLLRIITGQESADGGTITLARGTTVGYLEQGTSAVVQGTMEEELRRAFGTLEQLAERIRILEEKMSSSHNEGSPAELESVMEEYGTLRQQYEALGGYSAESRLRAVTVGLGFDADDLKRPVETFSGGERTRLRLGRLLLEEPDLLLLDEPTNHLDMAAVEWLERYLTEWRGCVLVVSHDRYFLDRVARRILALENQQLKSYNGNYSAYISQREVEKVTQEKAFRKQQDYITKEAAYIRTMGTGEREKRQAKSRQKRLDKLEVVDKPQQGKSMALDFGFSGRSGDIAVRLEHVAKRFENNTVFSDVNVELRWGRRVALVGPNGAGKSTLLKIIAGELQPDEGSVWLGPSVQMIYFDQHQQDVAPQKTPLDEIMDASGMTLAEARNYLGRFLFSGDDVFKRNADLSGGERSRLALAKLGLDAGNFLVLDEPTNHLDIRGVEELESALEHFPGTLLVVTHDRYFIKRTTEHILDVRDGSVRYYKMPYQEYVEKRDQEEQSIEQPQKDDKRLRQEAQKQKREEELAKRRRRRKLEQSILETEEEISRVEERINELEAELACPEVFEDYKLASEKGQEMEELKAMLEKLFASWEEYTILLEEG